MSLDALNALNLERNIWGHVVRGLEGIVVLCEQYEHDDLRGCPRKDILVCAERLREQIDRSFAKGQVDDDQYTLLKGKKV